MKKLVDRRPSPAVLVAMIALVFAVAGTSVAAVNALTKKEKKQVRNIAKGEISKAAPGLSVAEAAHAKTADSAKQADAVPPGTIGTAQLAGSIPTVRVTRTAAQSIPDSVETPIAFDAEQYDSAAMHDDATDNTRVIAPVTGVYAVTVQIDWASNANPGRELSLRRNGGPFVAFTRTEGDTEQQQVSTQVRLQAGDYIEAWAFQESNVSLNVETTSEYSPVLSMTWLAPG